ncbi:MAG: hypothetical protein GWN99_19095 [Gemmatimonadetes bacterium]|uniref:Glycosyltransferase RgtA/B/C/D-like domain-containing protein n=1 Tax=Candidatus Kutchimonas denitrificans TaxID=3056748 RepID=A0AAE5C9T1_9BACT|nr:hypothetical protein [Gemmatimonadota bacterium]NIR73772.1 hypothetical protein [Candidatus Kutchimonas denitrificans]NIS03136.1 hypothetical protein [Gemmatimonadota bacterium]NIT69037.1 hypothetical protein [Gemmatimonadota bacterium]NIU54128.1 hypothetical protein [Gemmatimonadota bacterium]
MGCGWELAILVAGAFLIRYSLFAFRGDYLDWDETLYLLLARNLLAGDGLSLNGLPHIALSPGVPIFTGFVAKLSGMSLLAANRLLSAAAGAALVVPAWYLFRIAAGQHVARLAALLLVGWTALIDVGPRFGPMWAHFYAGSEPLYLTALFGAFALGELSLRRGGIIRFASLAGAGAVLAVAYLARPEAVVIGGLYAVFRGRELLRDGRVKEMLVGVGIALATFLVVVAPHLFHLRQLTGTWMLSGNLGPTASTADLYQELVRDDSKIPPYLQAWWALDRDHERMVNPYWGVGPTAPWRQRLEDYQAALGAVWTSQPTGVESLLDRAGAYLLALWTLGLPLFLPFALVGLWPEGSPGRRFPPFVLAAFVGSLLISWQVYALPRFFLVLVPPLALWAGLGVVRVARWSWVQPLREPERVMVFVLLATGLGLAAVRGLSDAAIAARERGRSDRRAAERLSEAIETETALMSWHPRLAYWGGWDWRVLPVASLDAVVHYAAHRDVDGMFLARGSYSPLQLEADYVVILMAPELAAAYRELEVDAGPHRHPPARLVPIGTVAEFPTGLMMLRAPDPEDE